MLHRVLKRFIKTGKLSVRWPNGEIAAYGAVTPELSQPVQVWLRDWPTVIKLALYPALYLGETYASGTLIIEQGTLADLLEICARNLSLQSRRALNRFIGRPISAFWTATNNPRRSERNVAHHYDLSESFYRQFLDADMQYSCAYFDEENLSLELAQEAKKRHLAAKLLLKPGDRVLDIGCGWGGLALYLAKTAATRVTGITLSKEQLLVARDRARRIGLNSDVSFEFSDYRDLHGSFDRIVSVGMFEHVGRSNYLNFFRNVKDLLTDDGIAVIHSIGRSDGPAPTNPWIRKHIFPGGYIPALSEVLQAVEQSELIVTDIEVLRLHYAETLRHWRERFCRNMRTTRNIYDEAFCRMWDFYLTASEVNFRWGGLMVFQIQLARRVDTVPLRRTYMMEDEQISISEKMREVA